MQFRRKLKLILLLVTCFAIYFLSTIAQDQEFLNSFHYVSFTNRPLFPQELDKNVSQTPSQGNISPSATLMEHRYVKEAAEYKFSTLEDVHKVIFEQITSLQENGPCENKKILLCRNVEGFAGFGAMVSRFGVCMQVAYGLGRLFFISQPEYAHFGDIFHWLKPESENCAHLKVKYMNEAFTDKCNMHDRSCYLENGYDINNTHKVIELNTKALFPAPRHIPGTLPLEIETALLSFSIKHPWLWFTSQFLGYLLLRPNTMFNKSFHEMINRIGYSRNAIAFHIRHGDKISNGEAKYVDESVYLEIANQRFRSLNETKKLIYLASDDLNVYEIIKSKGTDFEITRLPRDYISKGLVSYFDRGFPKEVIETTLMDIYFMTYSSFLVCDLASNLARLAFELKQTLPPYKQQNIIHPVNFKGIFYVWNGYPFSFETFWVTSRANEKDEQLFGFDVLKYEKGELFEHDYQGQRIFGQNTSRPLIFMYSKYVKRTGLMKGLVYADDITKWPGEPDYYFFPKKVA